MVDDARALSNNNEVRRLLSRSVAIVETGTCARAATASRQGQCRRDLLRKNIRKASLKYQAQLLVFIPWPTCSS